VRSYRDTVRLFLVFTAADKGCKITRLTLTDLTFDQVVAFLRHLEQDLGNHARTRNQRLAALHCLFDYIAGRAPDMLATCQQVAAIPVKRTAPPETRFLERDEIEDLLHHLPRNGPLALRDRALILFLYNTGARAQEVAGLRAEHLDLGEHPLVRLHGKGGKWRACPLWQQTARLLTALLCPRRTAPRARHAGVRRPRATPHPLRHLQGHPPARIPLRRPAHRTASQPAHLPAHRRRPPARSRRRSEHDPRLARTRRPGHHQPLCRDQHQDQAGRPARRRTAPCPGGIPD
jgi:integrase